jgi:hypothetical protein
MYFGLGFTRHFLEHLGGSGGKLGAPAPPRFVRPSIPAHQIGSMDKAPLLCLE